MEAVNQCRKYASFGAESLIFDADITTIEQYSQFVLRELTNYVNTQHCLLIQYDGFIVNPAAWDNEFLKYDYIGAPWWYDHPHNVGNGGFSLRSKRFLDATARPEIVPVHPEDVAINRCRTYLEQKFGVIFAPEDVAARFSWEGNGKYPEYNGSFGFHGKSNIQMFLK